MTTQHTASLPNTCTVAEKNGGAGRGQPVATGSGSWQMLSAALSAQVRGAMRGAGCL